MRRTSLSARCDGFSLAELLVVVAVIAVLVAVSIPVFTAQLERSRRAVDMDAARCVQTALATAYSIGDIDVPESLRGQDAGCGAWVMFCRDRSACPQSYGLVDKMAGGTAFCGADPGVEVGGSSSAAWHRYSDAVERVLAEYGVDASTLKVASSGGDDGWDWVIVEVAYVRGELQSRVYSGYAGQCSGIYALPIGTTNIEQQVG